MDRPSSNNAILTLLDVAYGDPEIRLNSLSPYSDEYETSLYMITACLNIQVMRIKETITKDEMSRYVD